MNRNGFKTLRPTLQPVAGTEYGSEKQRAALRTTRNPVLQRDVADVVGSGELQRDRHHLTESGGSERRTSRQAGVRIDGADNFLDEEPAIHLPHSPPCQPEEHSAAPSARSKSRLGRVKRRREHGTSKEQEGAEGGWVAAAGRRTGEE